ncbi:MAG: flagellar type III secretion system pore protein FliP [Rhodocyclaceae bacterium]|nr:flagellar type III secretion system pore protein FliP [Rhodocyclaceae bacterium]
MRRAGKSLVFSVGALLLAGTAAAAEPALNALTATPGPGGTTNYSISVQTLLILTLLTFLPAAVLMMTAFTRIVIVLSLLRQALGTPTIPPGQVVIGLSLFLTFFVMAPVFDRAYSEAYIPYTKDQLNFEQALQKGAEPFRTFMLKQTRESDIALFVSLSGEPRPETPETVPYKVLVPAYVISELKTAFQIGFIVFIPFIIIDMVVASVLMSLGMVMLSPQVVSLPFKLMLFVLVDGWSLLIGSLVASFQT